MNKLVKYIIESRFNFNIDQVFDEIDNEEDFSLSKQQYKSKSMKQEYIENCELIVDLNLPSGTLWAKYNIGVDITKLDEAQDWIGNYYAWAEIQPKEIYNYSTYLYHGDEKAMKMKDYYLSYVWPNDNNKMLVLKDDAAYMNSNGVFRMPTGKQFQELLNNCKIEYVRGYNDISGLCGYVFISKFNGNQLFFPESNWKADDTVYSFNESANYTNLAFYWASTMRGFGGREDDAQPEYLRLSFSYGKPFRAVLTHSREFGMTIRGVISK